MNTGDSQHAGKIELPIPDRDIARVLESAPVILSLFNIAVSPSGSQTSRGEWVTLQGNQGNIAKAKKYIQALCNPELRMEACRQPSFARFLFSEHPKMCTELEREFQTVLSTDPNSSVLVQGSERDVYATVNKLHGLMDTLYNNRSHPRPSQHPVATVTATTSLQSTSIGREVNGIDRILCGLPSHVKQTLVESVHSPPVNNVIPRGSDPRRESRIRYFVDLGYSREAVETVLANLPDALDHVILARLVQCMPVKRVVGRGESGGSIEPPPARPVNPEQLRCIVIDGSNVAMRHGNGQVFSCRGIQLAVDYFKKRGHSKITVFVPEWRKEASTPDSRITDQHILHQLEQEGHLKYTPSRRLDGGRRIVCYDDRYIVKLATDEQGVIVSNDQFRDLVKEKEQWKEVIETRLLQFTFVNDYFMPPDDPLGRNGPSLDQLLSKDPYVTSAPSRSSRRTATHNGTQQICPHLERCTFGRLCKYYHPERDQSSSSGSTGSHTPSTSRSPTPSPSPDKRYMLPTTRSREDLVSGYHENSQSHIPLSELSDRLSGMSVHSKPEPPHYINLQQQRQLEQYPPHVMRSTPTLPTPQQDHGMFAPPETLQDRRPIRHTFPLMNLSPAPSSYVDRPRGVTEDLTRQLTRSTHLAVTPSLPHRSHTHEHEYLYDGQHAPPPRQLTGFPGPHPHPNYRGGLLPRDGEVPTHYRSDPYQSSASARHYNRSPTTHSHSYPQIPLTSHNSHPPRPRTLSEGHRGNQRHEATVFEQALAVLPSCEDRLRRVFARYPGISSYEEAVELARSID